MALQDWMLTASVFSDSSFFGVNSTESFCAVSSCPRLSFLATWSRWLTQPAFPLAAQMLSHL